MKRNISLYAKILDPSFFSKAMQAFDRATMLIVSVSWGGAVLLTLFALYTVNLSVSAKRQVVEAAAMEPSLPRIVTRAPEAKEMKPIVERLQKRFPELTFTLANDQSLTVAAVEGSKFRTWLTVLSYIDTISPQYRWQMKDFCVGVQCSATTPMRAILTAQKITFSSPGVTDEEKK